MEKARVIRPLISLIVPVWGDDDLVADLVNRLPFGPELAEWVVAAVEPSVALKELERRGKIRLVVCGSPSRGRQLNDGAREAHGSLLCFHHADSELLPEHMSALEQVASDETIGGGAFHRRFDDRHGWMARLEAVVRCLSTVAGPLFGDQSIFVKNDVFKRLGGFADIPLMEDIEFSCRLRQLTRVKLLGPPLRSSPRRFRSLGNWRSTILNIWFIVLFYLGISPYTLHRWYYRERLKGLKVVAIALLLIGQVLTIDRTVLLAAPKDSVTWDAVFAWIQRDWPEVPQMSTGELAQRIASNDQATPLLIDVRTREEYEISHLPGAIWAETPSQIASAMRGASDRQPVVLYCSVGVRSSRAAAKLIQSRRANVFNLQGSIFQWANEGRPLIANDHAVHVVHPYNERWGILLNPQLHPNGPN